MRSFLLVFSIALTAGLQAQRVKLPFWMLQDLGLVDYTKEAIIQDSTYLASLPATKAANLRFRGSFWGDLETRSKSDTMRTRFHVDISHTKGTIKMASRKSMVYYLIDFKANVAVIAIEKDSTRTATIHNLKDLVSRNTRARQAEAPLPKPVDRQRTVKVYDKVCKEFALIVGTDTTRIGVYGTQVSPFVDGWNWMPLSDDMPLSVFRLAARCGDPMPLFISNAQIEMKVYEFFPNVEPPEPLYNLTGHALIDRRGKAPVQIRPAGPVRAIHPAPIELWDYLIKKGYMEPPMMME